VVNGRSHIAGSNDEPAADLEGQDLFDRVTGFDDISRCRKNFQTFVTGVTPAPIVIYSGSQFAGNG
jgi:hypothetical protein